MASVVPFNPIDIEWGLQPQERWERLLGVCHRPSLLQSWHYAAAIAATGGGQPVFGIIRFQGRPTGVVLVIERRIGPIVIGDLYRGPAFAHAEMPLEMQRMAFRRLREHYSPWQKRLLRFHPELADTPASRRIVRRAGFRRFGGGYETALLDLTRDPAELRRHLSKGWRHAIGRARRAEVEITLGSQRDELDWLAERHWSVLQERRARGPSPAFLAALHNSAAPAGALLIAVARHRGMPVAGALVVRHGHGATYLVGWTDPEHGRTVCAQHLGLWTTIEQLRVQGCRWLDMGGFPSRSAGLRRFKTTIGGSVLTLAGSFL